MSATEFVIPMSQDSMTKQPIFGKVSELVAPLQSSETLDFDRSVQSLVNPLFDVTKGDGRNRLPQEPISKERLTKESLDHRVERNKLADRLQTLLYVLPAGVVVLDGSGVVQQCNAAATDLLGEPLEGEKWLDIIKRCFSPRHDDGHEVSLKDGRRVSISIRSLGVEPGQLILLTDLTETRELQAKLSRHERLSSMGKMVASLAHQVRTPLSTAMLYAGHLCQDEIEDELRKKCANKLMSRLVHLEQQVRDMLIFVKGDTPLAERISAKTLFEHLQQAADAPLIAAKAVVHWQVNVEDEEILCNREALLGAIMNLVNNSLEACQSHAELIISMKRKNEKLLSLVVADNGAGFDEHQKRKVREAFYTTKPHGTGLGLAVVEAVCKAHKGSFDIRSSANGTIATIELPVVSPV